MSLPLCTLLVFMSTRALCSLLPVGHSPAPAAWMRPLNRRHLSPLKGEPGQGEGRSLLHREVFEKWGS